MTTTELDSRNIALSMTSMRKSVENLVISSQDAIGQSISQALNFSGVISQHSSQIIHENRSVSRSPSPSLRTTDNGADAIDNDKLSQTSDSSLHVPCHPAGDSASVSSGEAVTVVNAPPQYKADSNKVPSPNPPARAAEGGGRTKKKSWYNSLYPTYKSKSDDFKRLFKDLPDDERLIVDYSCALQKDILVHGRLYASQNYLCFYASIFGWETSMSLRWKDVTAITKEKTALVIPNAILMCTENEKHFLTSFSGRDKVYLMLFRIWQNALMDQPKTSHEIWQWVHSCYGEELGFNSDDEGYSRELVDDPPALAALRSDGASEELIFSCMEAREGAADPRDERDSRGNSHGRDSSPPLVTNGDAPYREGPGDTLPTDMSDTSDSEPDKPTNGCEVEKCTEAHEGKLLLRQEFPFNIDQLFTMIFTNSKFNLELLAARGATDYVQAPWQPQGALKCRQIGYTLGLTSGPIGPKEVQVTETQIMNKCSKPGWSYSINCTSDNSGIPYADYFSVVVHYCLARVSDSLTLLSLHAHVKYKKSIWAMARAFLEKNTMGAIEEFARLLEARLAAEGQRSAPVRKARRHRRLASLASLAVCRAACAAAPTGGAAGPAPGAGRPAGRRWLGAALLLLLALNALLCYRLYCHEGQPLPADDLQHRLKASGFSADSAEWSRALQQQAARQHAQLAAWRAALARAVAHLAQTEQALTKLLESIKPSLEKAQQEAEPRPEL